MGETPVLEGRWVRLEPMREEHRAGLAAVASEESIWRYMNTRVRSSEELRDWMEAAWALERVGSVMAWVTVAGGRVVGATRLMDIDWGHRTAEIGNTWMAAEARGTQVNPEAKLLQLRYAFEELGMRRVAFKTHHENLQSQAAIRKLGAVYEGTFRNHYVTWNGSQRHSVWFSITREEWPGVRSRLEERLAAMDSGATRPSA